MLSSLKIKNLAIIKELNLELSSGLIVLTGETGAGKSIILDGINLLIGEKTGPEIIRNDEEFVLAEGVFELKENHLEILKEFDIETEGDEIIVRREIDKNGKNKITINGLRVTNNILKSLMENIVDLVGQHSHQLLLDKKHHIRLIDSFFTEGDNLQKEELEKIYFQIIEKKKKLEELIEIKKDIESKREFYEFQLKELIEAELKEDEYENLENEYKKLFNAGRIIENLNKSLDIIKEGETNILSMISTCKSNINNISKFDREFEKLTLKLEDLYYLADDIVNELEEKLNDIEINDNQLDIISNRLDKLNKLMKKYNKNISELIEYKNTIEGKLKNLEEYDYNEDIYIKEINKLESDYYNISKKISEKRRKIANEIEYKIIEELQSLNMNGIKFKVNFEEKKGIHKDGNDNVEFLISTNIGEDLKPLSKIVSGGEVSRIMLATKAIFATVDNITLLIFDEIDTGIGGETLRKVANKLKELSKKVQVICITHSPQIASLADIHFYIEKNIINNKTTTSVRKLSFDDRVKEIGRMLAGDMITDTVLKHAEELIKEGEKWITRK